MALKVAVIGAGAAGLTTAWELLAQGCEVEVFEASNGIAEGASFASSGLLGAAALVAWDFAGTPPVKGGNATLLMPPPWARSVLGMVFLRQRLSQLSVQRQDFLFEAGTALAKLNNERIASFLHNTLQEVETGQGVMVAFRSTAERDALQPGFERLKSAQTAVHEFDAAQARSLDTGVNASMAFTGAFGTPSDRVINGRQWLAHVKGEILRLGGKVHLNCSVVAITADGGVRVRGAPVGSVATDTLRFDAIAVCAATASSALLKPLGMELPMLVLNQCSISAPIREATHAPSSVWIDARDRVILSRTGQRLRASGGGVVVPGASAQTIFKLLYQAVESWFPGAALLHGDKALVQAWQSSVGHTPDGLPLVGATGHPRIWLNAAHGGRGWTFAAGAAKLLADLMTRQQPALDPAAFSPQRPMR